jgi:hypothetical protein
MRESKQKRIESENLNKRKNNRENEKGNRSTEETRRRQDKLELHRKSKEEEDGCREIITAPWVYNEEGFTPC